MSKKITLDPNLLNLSGPKTSSKSRKKYDKTQKNGKAHDVNYDKLLKKLKEMKKNKLQTKKKKRENPEIQINTPQTTMEKPLVHEKSLVQEKPLMLEKPLVHEKPLVQEKSLVQEKPLVHEKPLVQTPLIQATATPIPALAIPPTPALPPINTREENTPILPDPKIPDRIIPILPDPQFGILKNGNKPTRRNYLGGISKPATRFEKLRTIKRKYQLGKNGKKIGVLLKDNKTRKKIKNEIQDLKQQSIKEVRKFLQERNMIKAGSIAPNNVLRKMYEDMYLSGNIENKNSDNLLHNFMNKEEE